VAVVVFTVKYPPAKLLKIAAISLLSPKKDFNIIIIIITKGLFFYMN
jgi:hypothetical protein